MTTIDEKRLAEIRAEYAAMFDGEHARWMVRDLLATLDATREDMRAIVAAVYPDQPDATPTVRELCEHIGALHDAVASAGAWERDCEAVASALGFAPGEWVSTGLAQSVTDLRARAENAERKLGDAHETFAACHRRAEDAERKLAALHAAAVQHVQELALVGPDDDLDRAIADAASVAERHDREVELRFIQRVCERLAADRIERGGT